MTKISDLLKYGHISRNEVTLLEKATEGKSQSCSEQCPVCNNGCNLHSNNEGQAAQAEFIQSLVPTGTTIHRCCNYHQWLLGEHGCHVLHEKSTNKNFLDECKQFVVDQDSKKKKIGGGCITIAGGAGGAGGGITSTFSPLHYYSNVAAHSQQYSNVVHGEVDVDELNGIEAKIEQAIKAVPAVKHYTWLKVDQTKTQIDTTYSEKSTREISLEDE